MSHRRSWIAFAIAGCLITAPAPCAAQEQDCTDTPEGRICRTQQQLVSGGPVPPALEKELGLVTVGGRCSGTLVNRFWVLTADHCVTADTLIGTTPSRPLANLVVTATWSRRTAIPTRLVRNWSGGGGRDVAMLFLGAGDLGPANAQLYFVEQVETGQTITKYGRGIFAYATGTSAATAVAAQSDGRYRSGQFRPSASDGNVIEIVVNAAGQMANGGDSGGPDIVTAPNGIALGLAGVQSLCAATGYVPGMPQRWTWATGVSSCDSVALAPIRHDLIQVGRERKARPTENDFDDDNRPDVLWHNASTGEAQIWYMSGTSRIGRATIVDDRGPARIGLPWRIVGSRDFNADKRPDLLWYNTATGETQIWQMAGNALAGRATVVAEDGKPIFIGPPWSVVGTNDMNADGHGDIVWHNSATGATQIWLMQGHRVADRPTVVDENGAQILVGLPWSIVASNDLSSDGRPDLLWHNASTGEAQIWVMDAHRITGRLTVFSATDGKPALVGLPWRITSVNDFDGDANGDILWHNGSTGESQVWLMNQRTVVSRATVDAARDGGGASVGPPWRIMSH